MFTDANNDYEQVIYIIEEFIAALHLETVSYYDLPGGNGIYSIVLYQTDSWQAPPPRCFIFLAPLALQEFRSGKVQMLVDWKRCFWNEGIERARYRLTRPNEEGLRKQ